MSRRTIRPHYEPLDVDHLLASLSPEPAPAVPVAAELTKSEIKRRRFAERAETILDEHGERGYRALTGMGESLLSTSRDRRRRRRIKAALEIIDDAASARHLRSPGDAARAA